MINTTQTTGFCGVILATLVVINFPVDIGTRFLEGNAFSFSNAGADLIQVTDEQRES